MFPIPNTTKDWTNLDFLFSTYRISPKFLPRKLYDRRIQLNLLFSDWIFSNYMECIENVQCTPCTAHRLQEVLLLPDCVNDSHID